jgi:lysophospholipase L1-like esterase
VYDDEKERYVTLKDCYTSLLQDKLKGFFYNAGKFGNTIIRGINRLSTDVLKNNPDIVVIEFGGNDCDFNWEEVAKNPYADHLPNTDFNVFLEKLNELIPTLLCLRAI